jgi:hypothetical protein
MGSRAEDAVSTEGAQAGRSALDMARAARAASPFGSRFDRLLGRHSEERAWRMGAKGEVEVARRLRKLDRSWMVLHDLPHGDNGANIDHLAIGRAGVFMLNTKHLSGEVIVTGRSFRKNGYRTNYFPVAVDEARRVSRRLSAASGLEVKAWPVIVVIADVLEVRKQPTDVYVVAARLLVPWLKSLPSVQSDEVVGRLYSNACDPAVWRGSL